MENHEIYDIALRNYNAAWDYYVHCPESKLEEAKKQLDIARHIWNNI